MLGNAYALPNLQLLFVVIVVLVVLVGWVEERNPTLPVLRWVYGLCWVTLTLYPTYSYGEGFRSMCFCPGFQQRFMVYVGFRYRSTQPTAT